MPCIYNMYMYTIRYDVHNMRIILPPDIGGYVSVCRLGHSVIEVVEKNSSSYTYSRIHHFTKKDFTISITVRPLCDKARIGNGRMTSKRCKPPACEVVVWKCKIYALPSSKMYCITSIDHCYIMLFAQKKNNVCWHFIVTRVWIFYKFWLEIKLRCGC